MSKLFSLLKATMSEGVQLFNYRAKDERSKRAMPILLALLVGIAMFFSVNAMMAELKEDGAESAVLSLYTIVTAVIIVTEGIYKSSDLLFRPRDNDALLAMPIKKSTIVSARIIKFYLFEMLYCLIFLLPAIIAYAMNVDVEISYYLVAMTMLLIVPIIPITISCIMGLIISAASSKFKHKTFLQIVLSFAALFVFAILILMVNGVSDFDGRSIIAVSDKITEFYYPAAAFANLVTNFDIGQYLILIVINLAVLIVTIFIISRFYFQIITRINVVKHAEKTKYILTKHGQVFAVVKKELIKYFNTPVLLMNTAIGLVLFIVVVGALCLKFDDIAASLMATTEDFPLTLDEMRAYLPSVTFALVAFASLMTFITSTMISLEGGAFNLLKSLPISGKKVIMSKVLAAMLLIVPVTALGSIAMFVRFQFGILDMILILIAVVVIPLVTELIGILINLKYARFDAESDAVTVKQSASVVISTFLGLGMVLVAISLTFAAVFFAGQAAGLAMMNAVFVVIAMYLYFAVATWGKERYSKLAA